MIIHGHVQVRDRDRAGTLRGFVCLEDVSNADAPSRVVANEELELIEGLAHMAFCLMLKFAPDAQHRYAVTARLEGAAKSTGLRLVFGTTVACPWDPGAEAEVTVEVQPWI
jgi:uncharacterized lipoprotein YbaY